MASRIKERIPKGRHESEGDSRHHCVLSYNHNLAWQNTESEYVGLVGKVWAERIPVFDSTSWSNHCPHSLSFHLILLSPASSLSYLLLFLLHLCLFPSLSGSLLSLGFKDDLRSDQPWDCPTMEPSSCFVCQTLAPSSSGSTPSLHCKIWGQQGYWMTLTSFSSEEGISSMKSWSLPQRTKFWFHPSP